METGIVLRAVGIVLVVSTHVGWFSFAGAAHALMALAGFNFARFQLAGSRNERVRGQLRSLARIAAPSMVLIAVAHAITGKYTLANVFLLNAIVGTDTWDDLSRFWFVERLAYILAGLAVLLAVPWADRAQRRWPWAFPMTFLAAGLLTRFHLVDPGLPHQGAVLWLFALGWAAAVSRTRLQRAAVTGVALLATPGYFENAYRGATILAGLLLLLWAPALPVPRGLRRLVGVLAASSLYTYLIHWLIYPLIDQTSKPLAVLASLAAGVAYQAIAARTMNALERRIRLGGLRRRPQEEGHQRPVKHSDKEPAGRASHPVTTHPVTTGRAERAIG